MKHIKLLIGAPDLENRLLLKDLLSQDCSNISLVSDTKSLIEILSHKAHDLILLVHRPDKFDAINILKDIDANERIKFIILGMPGSIEEATEAMKNGASDFIASPWQREILVSSLQRALGLLIKKKKDRKASSSKETSSQSNPHQEHGIITVSPVMKDVLKKAKNIAKSKASVLIQGESGTGKELLARYIHNNSPRSAGPFIAINCAALPDTLLESELFGHEKGAFSGAISRRLGRFELANNGTLLLDEITEMEISLQAKLLRVLQESEIDRLGGQAPIHIDVRIIATTNRDVKEAVKEGKFREDLYFRLNVIPLRLPPLRERPEDIKVLAQHLCQKFCQEYDRQLTFAPGVIETLTSWPWPGNVRELRNVIERGVLLAQGSHITLEDLGENDQKSPAINQDPVAPDKIMTLDEMEKIMIQQALGHTDGNRTHAAKLLGISVRTLRNKLAELRRQGIVL